MSLRQVNIGGGGLTIGSSITGATPGSVLFIGGTVSAPTIAQDNTHIYYEDFTNNLLIGGTEGSEIVTNGTFTGNATGWTLASGWAYSSNAVNHTGTGTGTLTRAVTIKKGSSYVLQFTLSSYTSGTLTASVGGETMQAVTAAGTYRFKFTATATTTLAFTPSGTSVYTIDNVSIKELSGGKMNVGGYISSNTGLRIGGSDSTSVGSSSTTPYLDFYNSATSGSIQQNYTINGTLRGQERVGSDGSRWILTGSGAALNHYSLAGPVISYSTAAVYYHYGYVQGANGLVAGQGTKTSTLHNFGSTGLLVTRLTANTTLTASSAYTQILCDGDSASSCSGTPSVTACSTYTASGQATCESHLPCVWDAGDSCSAFDNELDMTTCNGTSGCTAVTDDCSAYGYDQTSCEALDDSYGGSCVWADPSFCVWADPDCTGDAACDAGDGTDQGTCESISYGGGCSGTFYTGSCTGTYGTACTGTVLCSAYSSSGTCAAETGCSWITGLQVNLPQISTVNDKTYWFKNDSYTSGSPVILNAYSGETIEGETTYILPTYRDAVHLAAYRNAVACSTWNYTNESTCETGHTGCTWTPCSDGNADENACNSIGGDCTWSGSSCDGTGTCTGTWYQSTDWRAFGNKNFETKVVFVQTATATVANTVTQTALTSTGVGNLTIPANHLKVGKTYRIKGKGIVSDTGTPTLRIRVKLGSTVVGDTGAIALVGTVSNDTFNLEFEFTTRSTGSSGTVFGQGFFEFDNSNNTGLFEGMPNTATTTINTTTSQAISVSAEWGTASSSNTISLTNLTVEELAI